MADYFIDAHIVNLVTLKILGTDPLKLNNTINYFLIDQNIILNYFYSLTVYKYPDQHQHFQKSTEKSYTYPFSSVCFKSPTKKSFERFIKHSSGYATN